VLILIRILSFLALLTAAVAAPAADPPFVPVFETDFPDPFILPHGGEFLAYATNAQRGQANVQMAVSTNLVDWAPLRDGGRLHDAMPVLPAWARPGFTWAPEVIAAGGGFILYFTAKERESGLQCIGAATGADPRGPFVSTAQHPLVCQRALGGSIDPDPFRDADGQLYLYYKNDGNNPQFHQSTAIFGQRLAPDGLSLAGDPVALLRNDAPWEAHVIEAPTMARRGTFYAMFFSANHFGWEEDQRLSVYAIGYARCQGPLGPCTDAPDNPILHSYNDREAGCLSGPGHQAVFEVGGQQFISFHAWAATPGCRRLDARRYLYIAPLGWRGDTPQIGVSLRPAPAQHSR
jgi:beta-xylosidase